MSSSSCDDESSKIIKPIGHSRKYENIVLNNEIECVIVSDKNSKTSSCCVVVNTGYYDDPDEFPGLAHFVEHLLFMGNEEQPDENYFHNLINENNGITNAFTSNQQTSYFYNINNNKFYESMNVFSHFFIDPLFTPSAIEREVEAVNSEHDKNLQNDNWRLISILKNESENEHRFKKFNTGNKQTLFGNDAIRGEILKFFKNNYSSNLMKLCVLHNDPIELIKNKVVKFFSKIKNKNKIYESPKSIFPIKTPINIANNDELNCQLTTLKYIKHANHLHFHWQITSVDKYYKYNALNFLFYIINHKDEGGLYDILEKDGLCHKLYVAITDEDFDMHIVKITLKLTKSGMDYIDKIIFTVSNYLNALFDDLDNRNDHYEKIYNDEKKVGIINFKNLQVEDSLDHVSSIALNLFTVNFKNLLIGPFMYCNYDKCKNIIKKFIKLNIKDCFILFASHKLSDDDIVKKYETFDHENRYDKWYDIHYKKMKLKITNVDEIRIFSSPKINKYIPNELILYNFKFKYEYRVDEKKLNNIHSKVIQIPNDYIDELWVTTENTFKTYKSFLAINLIKNYDIANTPLYMYYSSLYLNIICDDMTHDSFYLNQTGQHVIAHVNVDSITINVNYFENNVDKIINLIKNKIFNNDLFTDENKRNALRVKFDKFKDIFLKHLINKKIEPPHSFSMIKLNDLIAGKKYDIDQEYDIFEKITFDDFINYYSKLFEHTYSKVFIYGNFSKRFEDNVNDISKLFFRKRLEYEEEPFIFFDDKHRNFTNGQDIRKFELFNTDDKNICVATHVNIVNINNFDYEEALREKIIDCCFLKLIHTITKQDFFDELRTKKQLGYIVKSSVKQVLILGSVSVGMVFLVQSSTHNSGEVKKCINDFFKAMEVKIGNLNDENVNNYVETVKTDIIISGDFISTFDECEQFWYEISSGEMFYNVQDTMLSLFENKSIFNKNNLQKFYENKFTENDENKMVIIVD